MSEKQRILGELREEFERWQALLGELGEEEIGAAQERHSGGLSIKDEVAHLWAWQQISNARMEAALGGHEPRFPHWLQGLDPDADETLETINSQIHALSRHKSWPTVRRDWREGYLRLLRQAEAMPEADLLEEGRYAWMSGYPLMAVLEGTHDHHREHLEELLARMGWES